MSSWPGRLRPCGRDEGTDSPSHSESSSSSRRVPSSGLQLIERAHVPTQSRGWHGSPRETLGGSSPSLLS